MSNVHCPFCESTTYDNRNNKRSPKAPDFKCSNKSCGAGGWLNKEQSAVNFVHNGEKSSVTMSANSNPTTANTNNTTPKVYAYSPQHTTNKPTSVQEGIYTAWAKDLAVAAASKKESITKEELFDLVEFFFEKLTSLLSGTVAEKTTTAQPTTTSAATKKDTVPTPAEPVVDSSEINLEDFNFDDLGV
jgi:hypothetical protein